METDGDLRVAGMAFVPARLWMEEDVEGVASG